MPASISGIRSSVSTSTRTGCGRGAAVGVLLLCWLGALACAPVQAATIAGTVTERSTGNAIDGAIVCVFRTSGERVGDCGTTDTNGDYQATNVPAESGLVALAEADTYVSQFWDDVIIYSGYEAATPIDVSTADATGIDFTLDPAGTLAGLVTDADTGDPIGAGNVQLLDTEGNHLLGGNTQIQADGTYSHSQVAPGDYLVFFTPRGTAEPYIDEVHDGILCPDLSCDAAALGTVVTVTAGGNTTVDAQVETGSIISGTVTKSDGGAITEGHVTLMDTAGNFAGSEPIAGDGSYSLLPVPDGDYTLLFRATGADNRYVSEFHNDIPCPLGGCFDRVNPDTVTISGTNQTIDAILDPGFIISGQVTDTDTGANVPEGDLTVFDPNGVHLGSVPIDNGAYATDGLPPGDYKLHFLGSGTGNTYIDELYDEIPCEGLFCNVAEQGNTVSLVDSDQVIDEDLVQGALITGQVTDENSGDPLTGGVGVQALDSNVNRIGQAHVDPNGNYAIAVPDGDYFVFFGTHGEKDIYIDELHQDVSCPFLSCDVTANGTQVNVAGSDVTIDAALAQGSRISGTVSKASSGDPITEGRVELRQPDASHVTGANIDSNGNYDSGGLPDGDYLLFFNATGSESAFVDEAFDDIPCPQRSCDMASSATPVTISGSPLTVDEDLIRGNVLSGSITDADTGDNIPSGEIHLFASDGNFVLAQPFTDGSFALDGVPDGDYFAYFLPDRDGTSGWVDEFYNGLICPRHGCDFTADADPLSLTADTSILVDLTPGTPVDGQIQADSDGSAVSGHVEFFDASGNRVTGVPTDPDGNFGITLPDGEYRALAKANDDRTYISELWFDLPCPGSACDPASEGDPINLDGTPQTFDFSLAQGFNITGRVTEESSGSGLDAIQMCFHEAGSQGNPICRTFTDSNGDYVSPSLLTGDYKVSTNLANEFGLVDEVFDSIRCIGFFCDIQSGTTVSVDSTSGDASGIDFALEPGVAMEGQVVDSTTGEPLDGVDIFVWEAVSGNTNGVAGTTTDATGIFRIEGLIEGDYALRFQRDGYITQFFDGNTGEGETPPYCPDATCFGFPGPTVTVTAPELTGLVVDMDPGARVTGTISGPDGQPVTDGFGGVRVRVFDENGEPTGFRFTAPQPAGQSTYTAELPPGQWFFLFETSTPDLALVDTAHGGQPCPRGSCGMSTTQPVEVSAGDELTGVDGHLTQGATLRGQLLNDDDPGDPPLPESSTIFFYDADGNYASFGLSDSNGAFRSWTGLPTGTYFAATVWEFFGTVLNSGSPPGFIDELYDDFPCVNGCDYTTGTPIEVVDTSDVTGINLALSQGGSIAGTVTDDAGNPVGGATVEVFDSAGSLAGTQTTDETGAFTFEGLPVDDYFARTDNESGLEDELYDNILCEPSCDPLTGTPITLDAGAAVSGIDFALSAAASLSGTVTDNNGALAGIDVEVYNALGELVDTAATDTNGDWQVGNLAAGDYFGRTRNDVGLRDEVYNDLACSGCDVTSGTAIGLNPGANRSGIDFALILAGGIGGNVSGSADSGGDPLAGVEVQVFNDAGNLVASDTTNTNGDWEVLGLADGDYFVATRSAIGFVDEAFDNVLCEPDCGPSAGNAITVSGDVKVADFVLDEAATIAGTVNDDNGDAVLGITVKAFDNNGELLRSAVTGSNGGYQIGGLPAGDVFLRTATGGSFIDQVYQGIDCTSICDVTNGDPVSVGAGDEAMGIDFSLTPGGGIAGQVTDGAGNLQASLEVQIFDAAASQVASVTTDGNGDYVAQGLVDGEYFARTDNTRGLVDEVYNDLGCTPTPCGITLGTPIAISDGAQVQSIDFQLQEGSSLSGTATDPFGNPLPDGEVVLFDDQGRKLRRTAIVDGNWSFDGVADGTYFLVVLNGSGLVDELFDDIACPGAGCDVTTGTPVTVGDTETQALTNHDENNDAKGATGETRAASTNGTASLAFELSPGSRIRGHIAGPSGGVSDAKVFFFDDDGDVAGSATTNAAGDYESDSAFPAGDYFVATANGDERGVEQGLINELFNDTACPLDCEVTTAGQTLTLDGSTDATDADFTLAMGGALAGTAFDDQGNPLAGASIEVFDDAGNLSGTDTVDSLGDWRVDGLPDGDYTAILRTTLNQDFDDAVLGTGSCDGDCDPESGQSFTVQAPDETDGADFVLFPSTVIFRDSFE